MTDKQIIIDGVNIKNCRRRIGKDNFCRYYKRPCAENNYNCIWKKYLRKEQECEKYEQALDEIKSICLKDVHTFADGTELRYDSLDEILDIINKAKGEGMEIK